MDGDCMALAWLVCDDPCWFVPWCTKGALACAVFLIFGACLGWAEDSLARGSGAICPLQDFLACSFGELPKQHHSALPGPLQTSVIP